MAVKQQVAKKFNISGFIAWIVGLLVSLSVGSGMIQKILTIPYVPAIVTQIAGWAVVIGALVSIIAAIFDR